MDVQEATRKDYPAKQFNRTTRPIWRVVHISPEEQSIDSASCVGFACPECDIRAFRLIDKPPPIENLTLPAAFAASCVGFACPECDIRAFRLIDKPPPIENLTLPAAFAEYCADCCKGGLSSSRHKCLGKWMSELAYRSCQYKRNCLRGFLEALGDTRRREEEKGHRLSLEVLDYYVNVLPKELDVLNHYLLLFEQRRLLSKGSTMYHHVF